MNSRQLHSQSAVGLHFKAKPETASFVLRTLYFTLLIKKKIWTFLKNEIFLLYIHSQRQPLLAAMLPALNVQC